MSERTKHEQEQAKSEQVAIVEGYPDLRGCLTDQILFLVGGTRFVPIGDISMPITLEQAEVIVNRLREP